MRDVPGDENKIVDYRNYVSTSRVTCGLSDDRKRQGQRIAAPGRRAYVNGRISTEALEAPGEAMNKNT